MDELVKVKIKKLVKVVEKQKYHSTANALEQRSLLKLMGYVAWWPLLELLSWYTVFRII